MPFDSGGNFTRVHDFTQDRDNGIKIMSSRVDAEFDNFATGMNVVFFRNGLVPMSGNLDMGLNSLINLANGAAALPAVRFGTDAGSGLMLDGAGKPTLVSGTNKRIAATSTGADITGILNVSSTSVFTGQTTHTGGITSDGNLVLTNASTRNIMFGAAGVDGRLLYTASGATYRAADHEFFSIDGVTQFLRVNSSGLDQITGRIAVNQNNANNVPVLNVTNAGGGTVGMQIAYNGGGTLQIGSTAGSSIQHYHENRAAIYEVANNAFDAADTAHTFRHSAVTGRHAMKIKHMTAATTGDFLRGVDSADTLKFSISADGNVSFGSGTFTGLVLTPASASGSAGFRMPHGAAPSSPTNGDVWTTTAGLFARINGVTVGPYSTGGGGSALTMNNGGAGDASGTTFDGTTPRTISYNTIGAAPLASPTFTGTPAAPTAAGGTNTTQIATTAFVTSAVSGLAPLASPTFTGTPAAPTASNGTSTTQLATTAFVQNQLAANAYAPLASPALTGNPTAPTQAENTNNTRIATTAYVDRLKGLVFSSGAGTTLTTAHRGGLFATTAAVTCPNSVFAAGDQIEVYNNSASSVTITQGAGVTMRLSGTATTGSRTLLQRGIATITYVSASECIVSGDIT